MHDKRWKFFIPILALALSSWAGCGSYGGGDDTPSPSPTPGEPTPTPEYATPTPVPPPVVISGTITAVDRATGEPLDSATYGGRASSIVVYALQDPADLTHTVGKATLAGPGFYSMDVRRNLGKVYVVGVADVDSNAIITSDDVAREGAGSPVTVETTAIENVDIVFDLVPRGGGGTAPPTGPYSGTVTYDAANSESTNIAIVGLAGDYGGSVWGKQVRQGTGEYSVAIYNYGERTSLVAYADQDGNGLYEPSDPAGLATGNSYALNTSGASGIDIVIEGVGPEGLPQPIPYISISGTVDGGEGYSGTPIRVSALASSGTVTYASVQLAAPGNFMMRVPGNIGAISIQAITDSDGNGSLDATRDANAQASVTVGTSSIGGINLTLVNPVLETGVQGTLSWGGTPGAGDQLIVAIFDDLDDMTVPVQQVILAPLFPYDFSFMGLDAGTYYVFAALDVNSDWPGHPTEEDVVGAYTAGGTTAKAIELVEGDVFTDADFYLGNYTAPN